MNIFQRIRSLFLNKCPGKRNPLDMLEILPIPLHTKNSIQLVIRNLSDHPVVFAAQIEKIVPTIEHCTPLNLQVSNSTDQGKHGTIWSNGWANVCVFVMGDTFQLQICSASYPSSYIPIPAQP